MNAPRQTSTATSQCPPPLEESTGQRLANTPTGPVQNVPCRESPTPPGNPSSERRSEIRDTAPQDPSHEVSFRRLAFLSRPRASIHSRFLRLPESLRLHHVGVASLEEHPRAHRSGECPSPPRSARTRTGGARKRSSCPPPGSSGRTATSPTASCSRDASRPTSPPTPTPRELRGDHRVQEVIVQQIVHADGGDPSTPVSETRSSSGSSTTSPTRMSRHTTPRGSEGFSLRTHP